MSELKQATSEELEKICSIYIQSLIYFMVRRLEEVITNNGGPTFY